MKLKYYEVPVVALYTLITIQGLLLRSLFFNKGDEGKLYEERESISCDKSLNEIDDFLEELKSSVPHIDWDLQYHDHESGYYVTLTVPVNQYSEAEEIITAYENGQLDLSDYDPYYRYPGLYQYNEKDENYSLHSNVIEYVRVCNKFCAAVEGIIENSFLDGLSILIRELSELFHKAYFLPDIFEYISYTPGFQDPPQGDFIFGDSKTFERMPEYYLGSKDDIIKISEMITDIYQDIDYGLQIYDEADDQDEYIAAAIWNWRNGFNKENGWGENSLQAMLLIRECIRKIAKK